LGPSTKRGAILIHLENFLRKRKGNRLGRRVFSKNKGGERLEGLQGGMVNLQRASEKECLHWSQESTGEMSGRNGVKVP